MAPGCSCWSAPATTGVTCCTPGRCSLAAAPGWRRCCWPTGCTRRGSTRCAGPAAGSSSTTATATSAISIWCSTASSASAAAAGCAGARPRSRRALPDGALVVAADVPSGVDASTGEVAGAAVRADVTVTFGAVKTGLLVDPGAAHAGVVELVDIGLDLPPAIRRGAADRGRRGPAAPGGPRVRQVPPRRRGRGRRVGAVHGGGGALRRRRAARRCRDGALPRRGRTGRPGAGAVARGGGRGGPGAGLDRGVRCR